jgi:RNase P protein component
MQRQLPHWDFVVMAKPLAAATDSALLRQSLDQRFEHLKQKAASGRDG